MVVLFFNVINALLWLLLLLLILVLAKKKNTAQKDYLLVQKYVFFFSVVCELMLFELSDLIDSSWLKNIWIFSCKHISVSVQYIWRFRNQSKIVMIFGRLIGLVGGIKELIIKLSTKLKLILNKNKLRLKLCQAQV